MKLNDTTKVVSLVSAAMATMISLAGFFVDWRFKASDDHLKEMKQSIDKADTETKNAIARLEASAKMIEASAQARAKDVETAGATIKNSKDEFVLAARVQASFELPL